MREREREKENEKRERRDSHSRRRHHRNHHGDWSWSQRCHQSRGQRSHMRSRSCTFERRRRKSSWRRWEAFRPLKAGSNPVVSSRRASRRFPASSQQEKTPDRKRTEEDDQECSLFIDNLRRDTDVRGLRWLLRMDKHISRISISRKRRPNNFLCFAFVTMSSPVHVQQAVNKIHSRIFLGRKIFARQAKVEEKSFSGSNGASAKQRVSARNVYSQFGTPAPASAAPVATGREDGGDCKAAVLQERAEAVAGCEDGGECMVAVPQVDAAAVAGGACLEMREAQTKSLENRDSGACLEVREAQTTGLVNRDSGTKPQIVVVCCCRARCSSTEESAPTGCTKEDKTTSNNDISGSASDSGGYFWYGMPVGYWSSIPIYPAVGYCPVYSPQNFDPSGWYSQSQGQGWGPWPCYPGAGWHLGGREQSAPVSQAQNGNVGVCEDPVQRAMGSGVRAPIVIRSPIGFNSGPDPVLEDIIKNDRGRGETNLQRIDLLGNGEDTGVNVDPNDGASDDHLSKPGSEPVGPQAQLMDDDFDDIGLRSLFEDPEFPPGFEPVRDPSIMEDDTEGTAVREEARQTLIFAKRLGCTIPNEKLTLSNYEEIIRKQKASSRQSRIESDESIEESDSGSMNTSKEKGKRFRGVGPIGFSKFSRLSKAAMRGKKKAR